MSPPLPASSPPVSVTVIKPSLTSQPVAGNPGARALRQPLEVFPSNSRIQPSRFSFAVSVLGACADIEAVETVRLMATIVRRNFITTRILRSQPVFGVNFHHGVRQAPSRRSAAWRDNLLRAYLAAPPRGRGTALSN